MSPSTKPFFLSSPFLHSSLSFSSPSSLLPSLLLSSSALLQPAATPLSKSLTPSGSPKPPQTPLLPTAATLISCSTASTATPSSPYPTPATTPLPPSTYPHKPFPSLTQPPLTMTTAPNRFTTYPSTPIFIILLSYNSEDTQIFFYYDCSKSFTGAFPLRCSEGEKSTYVFTIDMVLPVSDCEENVVAPVMHAAVLWSNSFPNVDVEGVIK